ncbi:hypothetical protein HAHI6034_07355 [Hathewaya histolytica]|uniref:Uncharacterized protein n=1 Tax=Hathewaya histolytica TaxID=1498 RepID=A0A4U9QXW3_HATHI|nr:hypothetical protein [Hathewaya histolytica]VTQ82641.1 Uncharacterised protein [Hathewaya histolytica]
MGISNKDFIPRPGFVNKEGCLPDPEELVCIEVPKVFGQCLIKRCLRFREGPDTKRTDKDLRSGPLERPKVFLGCRDFNIRLVSFDKIPLRDDCDFSKLIVSFIISFCADFLDEDGNTCSELFEVNRTETIPRIFCPDSIARIATSEVPNSKKMEDEILKLELVAECLEGTFNIDRDCNTVLDITLGFHLIVKCELLVQLLIPAYGYCPVPKPCRDNPGEDACRTFNRRRTPKFYPDQNLKPLFTRDCDDDCRDDYNYDDEDESESPCDSPCEEFDEDLE